LTNNSIHIRRENPNKFGKFVDIHRPSGNLALVNDSNLHDTTSIPSDFEFLTFSPLPRSGTKIRRRFTCRNSTTMGRFVPFFCKIYWPMWVFMNQTNLRVSIIYILLPLCNQLRGSTHPQATASWRLQRRGSGPPPRLFPSSPLPNLISSPSCKWITSGDSIPGNKR
jgi:hypothetical protein